MDDVPPFGPEEARRLIDLIAARLDVPQTGMGRVAFALESVRESVAVIYGEFVPALLSALADPSADAARISSHMRDLHYFFRGIHWVIHETGWLGEFEKPQPPESDERPREPGEPGEAGATVTYGRAAIIGALRDLNQIVVSLDRIGSHTAQMDERQRADVLARFVFDWRVFRKLAEIRAVLESAFSDELGDDDLDELEREMQDVAYWRPTQQEPPDE